MGILAVSRAVSTPVMPARSNLSARRVMASTPSSLVRPAEAGIWRQRSRSALGDPKPLAELPNTATFVPPGKSPDAVTTPSMALLTSSLLLTTASDTAYSSSCRRLMLDVRSSKRFVPPPPPLRLAPPPFLRAPAGTSDVTSSGVGTNPRTSLCIAARLALHIFTCSFVVCWGYLETSPGRSRAGSTSPFPFPFPPNANGLGANASTMGHQRWYSSRILAAMSRRKRTEHASFVRAARRTPAYMHWASRHRRSLPYSSEANLAAGAGGGGRAGSMPPGASGPSPPFSSSPAFVPSPPAPVPPPPSPSTVSEPRSGSSPLSLSASAFSRISSLFLT
mmetsp:Transcript_15759/g.35335  ORF Transcript_15759/g.35335 Transcript_15759/m.35335 type:complete len:335 (-) Transcript_15759:281-1285(-)